MKTPLIKTICVKCGKDCILGIDAITTETGDICDACAQVKRGFAGTLLPEERTELIQTLQDDLAQRPRGDFTSELMRNALTDALSS